MPFVIIRHDITQMNVDAIVNAAHTSLQMGGGVCGAIFRAAGERELQAECARIGNIQTGEAAATKGCKLPARYVIHTAGPVYRDGNSGEAALLRDCYINSLNVAQQHDCESIAFPLISTGIYGYPKADALRIASEAIQDYLSQHDMQVYLVVFDKESVQTGEQLMGDIQAFIDEHYVADHADAYSREAGLAERRTRPDAERREQYEQAAQRELAEDSAMPAGDDPAASDAPPPSPADAARRAGVPALKKGLAGFALDHLVGRLDESFSETLLRLIDVKGKTDVEVYKRANIDRKLFSKIRNSQSYTPSKRTALAFAIALELNVDETKDLLERAGFTLSRSQKFDVIIEYFIANASYDVHRINEVLFHYDQPLLGA